MILSLLIFQQHDNLDEMAGRTGKRQGDPVDELEDDTVGASESDTDSGSSGDFSSSDNDSDKEKDPEDDDIVNIDFDFFDPAEIDFHGLKSLLRTYLDGEEFGCSELVETIIKQVRYDVQTISSRLILLSYIV